MAYPGHWGRGSIGSLRICHGTLLSQALCGFKTKKANTHSSLDLLHWHSWSWSKSLGFPSAGMCCVHASNLPVLYKNGEPLPPPLLTVLITDLNGFFLLLWTDWQFLRCSCHSGAWTSTERNSPRRELLLQRLPAFLVVWSPQLVCITLTT